MDSVLATLSDSNEALPSMSILGLNMNLPAHDKKMMKKSKKKMRVRKRNLLKWTKRMRS